MKFGLNFNCACVNWKFGKGIDNVREIRRYYKTGQFLGQTAHTCRYIERLSMGIVCSYGPEFVCTVIHCMFIDTPLPLQTIYLVF